MNNQYDHMMDALDALGVRGYSLSFQVSKDGRSGILDGKTYLPGDIVIIEHHRFEGMTNPDDMSIVYAIETSDGHKGLIIDAFGTYASLPLGEFIKKILRNR